jgi:hypothetical protein
MLDSGVETPEVTDLSLIQNVRNGSEDYRGLLLNGLQVISCV